MEDKISILLRFIHSQFPQARFEIIHNSFSPTLTHFIIREGANEKGFGTDHNSYTAIQKAYSEFIERKTLIALDNIFGEFNTSNGFSAHTSKRSAIKLSQFEVIERDSFLLAWHGKVSPYWLTQTEITHLLNESNSLIFKKHKEINLDITLGIVAKSNEVLTCIAKVSGTRNNQSFFYIDTKSGTNLRDILNSLIESITFFSHYVSKKSFIKPTKNNRLVNPIDHFYYYLNHKSSNQWFHKKSNNVLEIPSLKITSYHINPDEYLNVDHIKRYVAFSESDCFQSYYCGRFNNRNINFNRFKKVFGDKITFNLEPHPLS